MSYIILNTSTSQFSENRRDLLIEHRCYKSKFIQYLCIINEICCLKFWKVEFAKSSDHEVFFYLKQMILSGLKMVHSLGHLGIMILWFWESMLVFQILISALLLVLLLLISLIC